MATLEEAIKEASGHVDDLITSMQMHGSSEFEKNFADKVLRPALFGLITAHATQTNVAEIENAIVDTFCSITVELLKRTHKNKVRSRANADEAGVHAQQLINQIASQLSELIEDEFAPKVKLVTN